MEFGRRYTTLEAEARSCSLPSLSEYRAGITAWRTDRLWASKTNCPTRFLPLTHSPPDRSKRGLEYSNWLRSNKCTALERTIILSNPAALLIAIKITYMIALRPPFLRFKMIEEGNFAAAAI